MKQFLRLVLLAFAVAGCGQELTAGGLHEGEVSAVATDDAETAPASSTSSPGAGMMLSRSALPGAAPTGTVQLDARVSLVSGDGEIIPLASTGEPGSLRIAARDSTLLGRDIVRATRYTHARVTFNRVEANLTGGLVVGMIDLTGPVRVDLAAPLTVEIPVALEVRENGRHLVVIDLNAGDWLSSVNPLTRLVPTSAFVSKLQIRVR